MFVKVTNGEAIEYTIGQLLSDYPNVSFPKTISISVLEAYGIFPYMPVKPDYDMLTQHLIEVGFSQDSSKAWIKTYVIENTDLPIAEQAIRTRRNELLAETDWRFRSDLTPTQKWIDYCKALRDITAQQGFPYSVVWPEKPV